MTLHHLEIFLAVCEEKTMHAAAKKMNLSQPAISKSIAELEKYYQICLFERINRKLYLTAIGETMRIHAMQVMEAFRQMETELYIEGQQNHIRIGASVSVGTRMLPPLLQKLEQKLEGVTFEVIVHNTSRIEQLVENYSLDLGIVEGCIESESLAVKAVAKDELVFVVRSGHPLRQKERIEFQDLEQYFMISREEGSTVRNQLEVYLQQLGLNLTTSYSCSNTEAIKQALIHTDGIAVFSKMMIEEELRKGVLSVLPLGNGQFPRTISLIYQKNKYISLAMKTLISILENGI